jgi:hypothetical protein
MAKAMSITTATADAMLTAFATLCNNGIVRIYNGAIPADVNAALSGNNILAQATMAATSFVTPFVTSGNNRRATANTITGDSQADLGGTASFFRVFTSGNVAVWQGTVGVADADMIVASTTITINQPVNITSMVVSFPMS